MTAEWGLISQELMKRGILVTTGVKDKLLSLNDPIKTLDNGPNVGFNRGMLTLDILNEMITISSQEPDKKQEEISQPIGRTIAPIKEPEPVKIQYRNNLPIGARRISQDWLQMLTMTFSSIMISLETVLQREKWVIYRLALMIDWIAFEK